MELIIVLSLICKLIRKANGVLKKMHIIRELYGDRKIIIGRDRLDQIKGVEHKLYAFKKFLSDYPGIIYL
jgi:trehalose 6-phosphate synthase/phosphatase